MSGNNQFIERRAVLRAAGVTFAASMGAVEVAADSHCEDPGLRPDECVVTNKEAKAYKECPAENYVWDVEEGRLGRILELCCDKYGQNWAKVHFECIDETWTVSTDDIDGGQICTC